jgi:hypothetical protein
MHAMYKLRSFDDQRWAVVDPDDREVHVGTLRECEDWLDQRENVSRSSIPREPGSRSWLKRLWDLMTGGTRRKRKPRGPRVPDVSATPPTRGGP